ncbi:hypothetical protein COV18_01660 [Candidatus Woesearchaeota archaeon CG10_big_fil_rev_8_21_14_0_10_37_12]|nr:MAG: hypothetical protein COV18_01660 [Candidatus Woesearchaeota archaeon CG10_big_fil_rev_8_21_14_0_10_37_12]
MKLTIIGTSHISPESLKHVEETIREKKPTIIAVELDKKRLAALLQKKYNPHTKNFSLKDIKRIGLKGWLFAQIGSWVEKKLGNKVGVSPGTEMLKAIEIAQQTGAKIALIDQDIEITLKKFSNALSWKEKWTFAKDLINGLIFKKGIKFDLAKVPSHKIINKLIKEVKTKYPNVYCVLIKERNEVMAKKLAHILLNHPDAEIVAVVGAGHEKEINLLVKKIYKEHNIQPL